MCIRCGRFTASDTSALGTVSESRTTTLDQVEAVNIERIVTGGPWDACWGGGFVPSAATMVGGGPGLGKTTLLLQLASRFAEVTGRRSYFLSAEQSPGEIRITANRLGLANMDRLRVLSTMGGGAEIDEGLLSKDPPAMFVVDSISALCGKDKHAALVIAKRFKVYSTRYKAPSFLIAHMTKENDYAGLMSVQHEVDVLCTLFGVNDRTAEGLLRDGHPPELVAGTRELRAWKNRFGATNTDYHVCMTERGLVALPPPPPKREKKRKTSALANPIPPEELEAPRGEDAPADLEPPPRLRARTARAPDAIEHDGQKLVRKRRRTKETPGAPVIDLAEARRRSRDEDLPPPEGA